MAAVSKGVKHVIYILKENRTYDQVLGDLVDENGMPIGDQDTEPGSVGAGHYSEPA